MRAIVWFGVLAACGGGNDVDPRVIPGGGIGDGPIDGEVNVFVIDDDDNPIADATVQVGDTMQTTDDTGLVVVTGVSGRQTIAVVADGFRDVVWAGANGANVTIPIEPLTPAVPDRATLTGSIAEWSTVTVPQGHLKAAIVFPSATDDLNDDANNLTTPNNGNICGALTPDTCDWTLVSRTGAVTVMAMIVDLDPKGTPDQSDDTLTIIGWATLGGVTVQNGVAQSGLTLALVEAGNLEDITVDLGAPPAGLPEQQGLVGIEANDDEVIQLPLVLQADTSAFLVPRPTVFSPTATYRLTAIAQTTSGDQGAQSIVIRRGETGAALDAGTWLIPPTGLDVTRTGAAFEPVAGAKVHTIGYFDAQDTTLCEVTIFDGSTAIDLPSVIELPSGALAARVAGIGADLDVSDFSLEEDDDLLFGLAAEPTQVP